MRKDLIFDERELAEIHHAIHYKNYLHHGTTGHNQLMLIAKMADALGFELSSRSQLMFFPDPTPRDLFFPDGSVEVRNESS